MHIQCMCVHVCVHVSVHASVCGSGKEVVVYAAHIFANH